MAYSTYHTQTDHRHRLRSSTVKSRVMTRFHFTYHCTRLPLCHRTTSPPPCQPQKLPQHSTARHGTTQTNPTPNTTQHNANQHNLIQHDDINNNWVLSCVVIFILTRFMHGESACMLLVCFSASFCQLLLHSVAFYCLLLLSVTFFFLLLLSTAICFQITHCNCKKRFPLSCF